MKKIVLIEDDGSIQESISDLLSSEGFDVSVAGNGVDGIKLIEEIKPDLIISDIIMPGKTGYEVINEISKNAQTAAIPFIFLSARVEKGDVRHGMELGADDYLTKPFRLDELLRAVESRLKKKQMILAAGNNNEEKPEPEKNDKLKSDEYVYITVNNKPKFLKIKDIKCIIAEAEYSVVHTANQEKLLVRKLLKNWEKILPENSFLRIHRSTIINLDYIIKTDKWFNNSMVVYLKNIDEQFVISRRYASVIKHKLNYG